VESQFADEDYAAEIAQFFINQLLSHGTTTALVFCTLHPESVDALFTEALRLNMRLLAGKVMMDRHTPDYLSETAEQSYRQTRELIQRWHHQGPPRLRHHAALCPDVDAGAADGGSTPAGRVPGYLAAYPPERKPQRDGVGEKPVAGA
jgi:cytosine/adenosine deaminase-related metal-dependent hydrolase